MNASVPRPPSLKLAVLGMGNIGSTFAFQLARTGHHDVTAIARPDSVRLHQLQRDDGIVDVRGERAAVRILDALDEETPYDLLIVTVLDYQAKDLLPSLQRSSAKNVLFLFNTFHPERLEGAIGLERCAFGMPFVQAIVNADGKLKATIGANGQKTLLSGGRWVEIFEAAGLPAALEPEMKLWLRCHVPMCVAFESVAVAGQRRRSGASWKEAMTIARGVRASFYLIRALGHRIYPRAKRLIARSPVPMLAAALWALSRIATFRDLLATGEVECEHLIDDMIAAAPRAKPVDVARIRAMKPA